MFLPPVSFSEAAMGPHYARPLVSRMHVDPWQFMAPETHLCGFHAYMYVCMFVRPRICVSRPTCLLIFGASFPAHYAGRHHNGRMWPLKLQAIVVVCACMHAGRCQQCMHVNGLQLPMKKKQIYAAKKKM
jgi:hypothetical protein